MALLRKIALGLLLAAAAGVLLMAAWELWNYRQWAYLALSDHVPSTYDRARILQDRVELLTKRVGDMELLVLILLGTSGLYAIVFVASSYFSATSFARQADQTINHIQDQIGLAMGDLRELQEETTERLTQMTASPAPVQADPAPAPTPTGWETQVAEMAARIAALSRPAFERTCPYGTGAGRKHRGQSRSNGGLTPGVASRGPVPRLRARLRVIGLGTVALLPGTRSSVGHAQIAPGVGNPLPVSLPLRRFQEFPRAMRELAAAFEHQFKALDERLASDIEEGGKLYELASTAPFDKAVNDLLLNMSIGIG